MRRALTIAALAAALLATACTDSGLEERVAALEQQLADEIGIADRVAELRQVHEVAAATAVLDQVDLQGLMLKLAGEERLTAIDTTSVLGAARAMKRADWPDYLVTEAENIAQALDGLGAALRVRDRERAAALAPPAFAFQTEMRRRTDRWLEAVEPWKRTTRPPHVHGPDSAHMDHDPRHEGVVGMWGDLHVETRIDRDGRVHCWLTGPTREPVTAAGVRGEVVLHPDTERQLRVPLMLGGEDFLMGRARAFEDDSVHVTVRLQGTSEGEVEMDFALPVREPAGGG